MRPYQVVEDFELALSEYTGAPYVVTTNSCSMGLFLALKFQMLNGTEVEVPCRTYCSVPNQVIEAGGRVKFVEFEWEGVYQFYPTKVWDSARSFYKNMYLGGFVCISFQTSKILGLEQGGAILHDNPEADEWLRRARFDGRLNASEKLPKMRGWHAYMSPTVAALGIQKLACLPDDNPDNGGSYMFEDLSKLDIWNDRA